MVESHLCVCVYVCIHIYVCMCNVHVYIWLSLYKNFQKGSQKLLIFYYSLLLLSIVRIFYRRLRKVPIFIFFTLYPSELLELLPFISSLFKGKKMINQEKKKTTFNHISASCLPLAISCCRLSTVRLHELVSTLSRPIHYHGNLIFVLVAEITLTEVSIISQSMYPVATINILTHRSAVMDSPPFLGALFPGLL